MNPKFLLIEPPSVILRNSELENTTAVRRNYPKLSQIAVGTLLQHHGAEVRIIDMKLAGAEFNLSREITYGEVIWGNEKLTKRLEVGFENLLDSAEGFDCIGLTCNFTQQAGIVLNIVQFLRKQGFGKYIIVGGTDATTRAEPYLRAGANLVVLGEGETLIPEIVSYISGNTPLNIEGIAILRDQQVCETPSKGKVDLNEIPLYDFGLVDISQYWDDNEGQLPEGVSPPLMYFESSRGCGQTCSFCTTPFLREGYRYMNVERVAEWLDHFRRNGINTLLLIEDSILGRLDFPNGREDLIEIFRLMRCHKFAWQFANGIEVGKLWGDEELINILFGCEERGNKRVGCYRSYIPLERLADTAPKECGKLRPWKEMKEIVGDIVLAGVPALNFGVIIGMPNDTIDTMETTLHRCQEIKDVCLGIRRERELKIYFNIFCDILLPGTPDYRKYSKRLAFSPEEHPELWNFYTPVINGVLNYIDIARWREKIAKNLNGEKALEFWKQTARYY